MVNVDAFVGAMTKHWQGFDNTPSSALQAVWRQAAETFNGQIAAFDTPDHDHWKVLQPPTGTGKTLGLAVYCSMLPDGPEAVGVLVITRLIAQADDLVGTINKLAGRQIANPHHSKNRLTSEELISTQVLVITHKAGLMAFDRSYRGQHDSLEFLNEWKNGPRRLTVIDEALDVVDHHMVTADNAAAVEGSIPREIARKHPEAMGGLRQMRDVFDQLADVQDTQTGQEADRDGSRIVRDNDVDLPTELDLSELRRELRGVSWDRLLLKRDSGRDRRQQADRIDDILKSVQMMWERWRYYSRVGKLDTLNSAEVAVPPGIHGPVLLDATASQNLVWRLFDGKVKVVAPPAGARSYANVRLHITTKTSGLGKRKMIANGNARCGRLMANLAETLGPDRKVFVCCHRDVEPHLKGIDHPFEEFSVGHYGAVDGLNDWAEFDTAVVFGLPYRSAVWAINVYMALRGLQDDEWMENGNEIRQELIRGQIVVSVVQAINRVRCRRVIDGQGNCAPTDVFILLPKGVVGEALLKGLMEEMPGLKICDWDFDADGGEKRPLKRTKYADALRSFMKTRLPGETAATTIREELGIPQRTWKRMVGALKNETSDFYRECAEIGVTLKQTGRGRGSRTFLVKA